MEREERKKEVNERERERERVYDCLSMGEWERERNST